MTPRNPSTGQWTYVSPVGADVSTAPDMPKPGPTAQVAAKPQPLLVFTASASPCQSGDCTAVATAPGMAGPCPANPTSPMQDFGQVMGQTLLGPVPSEQMGGGDAGDE